MARAKRFLLFRSVMAHSLQAYCFELWTKQQGLLVAFSDQGLLIQTAFKMLRLLTKYIDNSANPIGTADLPLFLLDKSSMSKNQPSIRPNASPPHDRVPDEFFA